MSRPLVALLLFLSCHTALFAAPKEIVVCHYNVENYVNEKPRTEVDKRGLRAKPESQIAALISIITDINPDILGVCEMGTPDRFDDFKKRLADAGLGYIDFEYVQAADADRHLALVSRFPIVARNSATDVSFEINGQPEKVRRGFLDVTVQINADYQLRLVGAHLKSKLPIPEGEALIRRHEAQKLRTHLEKIMTADPQVNLLCYGDFNDSKNQPIFAEISGVKGSANYMADIPAKDSLGEKWTYFWKVSDEYSRIDYLFASPALIREIAPAKSRVYRSDAMDWAAASDHRAVFTSIIPFDKK